MIKFFYRKLSTSTAVSLGGDKNEFPSLAVINKSNLARFLISLVLDAANSSGRRK